MNAYVYRADIYCEGCAVQIKQEIREKRQRAHPDAKPPIPADETLENTYSSDFWPKGPYPDGGGEADIPNYCAGCGVFLENPLTELGEEYVRAWVANEPYGREQKLWQEFYSYLFWDEETDDEQAAVRGA
jgi:hypothetical protein